MGLISTKSQDGAFVTEFQPTELMINDSLWLVVPGSVVFKDKRISVADLGIARQGQSLNLNGHVSKDKDDKLVADVERIDVNYILELFNVKPVKISGNATGRLTLAHAFDSLKVEAKGLDVPNFAFNDAYIGHGKVDGSFSMKDKRLWLHGDIQEKGIGYTLIDGYVGIGEKSIDLKIRNKNTNLAFLNKYILQTTIGPAAAVPVLPDDFFVSHTTVFYRRLTPCALPAPHLPSSKDFRS